jgi:hypothetical protein
MTADLKPAARGAIDDRLIISQASCREGKARLPFVEMVDNATGLLQSDDYFESPFELIATEAGIPEAKIKKYYDAAKSNPRIPVPEEVCTATRAVLSMIVPEIARRVMREIDQLSTRKAERRETLENALESRGIGRGRKKRLPRYKPKLGYVGSFALKALVDRLVEDKIYRSAEDVDEALSQKGYCNRGVALDAYNKGRQCTHRTYEGVAKLVLEHCNNGETVREVRIKFLKYVDTYTPTETYTIGQLVRLPKGVGVVTRKLPHNKIEVVRIDGQRRNYLENQQEPDVYLMRKPRGATSGH